MHFELKITLIPLSFFHTKFALLKVPIPIIPRKYSVIILRPNLKRHNDARMQNLQQIKKALLFEAKTKENGSR